MTDVDATPTETHRPALQKLTQDLQMLRQELFDGFRSRRAILDWLQRLTVRTLGQLPQRWYMEMARQFRGRLDGRDQRTLLAALLRPECRTRDLDEVDARNLRERLYVLTVRPYYHRAFRHLRPDATEYIDQEGDVSGHDPSVQRYVAMRPALDEIEEYQRRVFGFDDHRSNTLLDGFETKTDIIDWGDDVELATHGEVPEGLIERCYAERSTRQLLLDDSAQSERARELFAAFHVLPYCNAGVRDLAGRAGEQPDAEQEETEVTFA